MTVSEQIYFSRLTFESKSIAIVFQAHLYFVKIFFFLSFSDKLVKWNLLSAIICSRELTKNQDNIPINPVNLLHTTKNIKGILCRIVAQAENKSIQMKINEHLTFIEDLLV